MYRFNLIVLLLTLLALAGCGIAPGTDPGEEEEPVEEPPVPVPDTLTVAWSEAGLSAREIYVLEEAGGMLFAGTDQGVFKTETGVEGGWENLGLATDTSRVADLILWNSFEILAGVSYDEIREDNPVLYKSIDGGASWEVLAPEVDEKLNYFYVYHLDFNPDDTGKLYGYGGYVLRSEDKGESWKAVYSSGVSEFIYVSKNHPRQIWTGGWNNIFTPYLAKSTDGGDTWTLLNDQVYFNAEANANAAVVSPDDEQTVLVGFGNFGNLIRKSTDGGQTWRTVVKDHFIQTMKNSVESPGRVYASGIHREGYLYVLMSDDYGESWGVGVFEAGPQDVWVHDLAVVETGGTEVVYFGTNQGVFRGVVED